MNNKFLNTIKEVRANVEVIKAEEAAKEIKQYGGLDVYNLMKEGNIYAVVVDGIDVGGASSKEDADKAVELLSHFTNGRPLDKNTLRMAMDKAYDAMKKGNDLKEANDAGITFDDQIVIDDIEYVIDNTGELMAIDGYHIGNVADIMAAKKSGALTKELYEEILKSRIQKKRAEDAIASRYEDEDEEEYYEEDWDDEN